MTAKRNISASRPKARSRPTITATEGRQQLAPCDLGATRALAARLAALLRPGDVVALQGDLGAGKSELARAVIRALAGAEIEVPSPTFTLVQGYDLPGLRVTHADLYRLADPQDLAELGLDEALILGALLVEWPEHSGGLLPADRLTISLTARPGEPDSRNIALGFGPSWRARITRLAG